MGRELWLGSRPTAHLFGSLAQRFYSTENSEEPNIYVTVPTSEDAILSPELVARLYLVRLNCFFQLSDWMAANQANPFMAKRFYLDHASAFSYFLSMLRSWITKGLAPIRWAIRFELERQKLVDSRDIETELQRMALRDTAEYVTQHMMGINSFDSHLDVLSFALKQVSKTDGLYLEFGVFQGGSINHIAGQAAQTVYGFDSFEGLPERWKDRYDAGHFKVAALPAVRANVTLVKGWFDKTLPEFLKEHPQDVSFLHVDCDLYSSTQTIFSNLASRIKVGTVIVFDEYFNYPGWRQDEFKAFQEFVTAEKLKYEYVSYRSKGEQVCVRITEKR